MDKEEVYTHTYTYTQEQYSAIIKKEILQHATTWMDPDKSDRETEIYHFTYMWNLKNQNKQIKQEQTHRYKENFMVTRWDGSQGKR